MNEFTLHPGQLSLGDLRAAWSVHTPLALATNAWDDIAASSAAVAAIVAKGEPAYGINTGFGILAKAHIPVEQLATLQRNLILSHAVGTGPLIDDHIVRLILLTKIGSLARGYSGVRPLIVETLIALYNANIMPAIPVQGSVGASGDLAPLAHMTLAMLGVGQVRHNGVLVDASRCAGGGRHRTGRAGRERGPGADQRHPGLDRAGAARPVPGRAPARSGAGHRRIVGRRRARQRRAVRCPHPRGARTAGPDRGSGHLPRAGGRQRDPRVAPGRRRARAGPVQPALPAAGDGRRDGPDRQCRAHAADRGECRHRQSAAVRRRRHPLGRQLPCRAGSVCRRLAGAGHRRNRRAGRTPHRAADRRQPVRPAGVPRARAGPEFRLHDRPRDGSSAGVRKQVAGPSRQRRQPADVGQPGRPCQHGDLRGAPSSPDGAQYLRDRRHRAAGRVPGHRISPSAAQFADAGIASTRSCASRSRRTTPTASLRRTSRRRARWCGRARCRPRARSCSRRCIRKSTRELRWNFASRQAGFPCWYRCRMRAPIFPTR